MARLEDMTYYRAGGLCRGHSSKVDIMAPRGSQDHVLNTLLYMQGTKMRDFGTELRFPVSQASAFHQHKTYCLDPEMERNGLRGKKMHLA